MRSLGEPEIVLAPAAAVERLQRQWRGESALAQTRAAVRRSGRCACGVCRRCLDDARWERIFKERFADPGYYTGILVRHNSCLAGV